MGIDDLKLYSIMVGGGSGVIYQPATTDYTYVLTAKHIFFDTTNNGQGEELEEKKDGEKIEINRLFKNGDIWDSNSFEFTIQKNINYFPHDNVDCAILKIDYIPDFDNINIEDNNENVADFLISGFPAKLRSSDTLTQKYSNYKVDRFISDNNQSCRLQLENATLMVTDIKGMSGCGVLRLNNNNLSIIGIQSEVPAAVANGQIDYVPMKYFNEIVYKFPAQLNVLLPPYISNFSFLKDKIFNINAGVDDHEIVFTRNFLKSKSDQIIKSDITPVLIKDFFKERLLLNNKDLSTLNDQVVYATWLEFLVIMNIARNKVHSFSELEDLFNTIRLIYKNTNSQWQGSEFLKECMECDLNNLQDNATVLIKTDTLPEKTKINHYRIEKGSMVSDINHLRKEYQNGNLGDVFIDDAAVEAKEFVFDKYTFIHFEFLKKFLIVENSHDFKDFNMNNQAELLQKLNSIYGELFGI